MAVKELEIKPFSKKGYKTFKFEEIAFSISERVEPKQTDLKVYVGLEHLDPDSIHIKRFGTPADVEGTKLKVYPGDLIFGKRRAYQRKAAVANFEGICSAHAIVLRANPKVIIPELFPFFIHSDQFMNRAIDISVGSLSPTINWGTLKSQEFLLPPKEQQAKLAELLWAGDEVVERYEKSKTKLKTLLIIYCESEFNKSNKNIELGELGSFYKGRGVAKGEISKTGLPCIRYGELYNRHHHVVRKYYSFISEEVAEKSFPLHPNDILFAGSGETLTEIGKSAAIKDAGRIYAGSDTIVFRPKNMNGIFLGYFLNGRFARAQLDRMGKGATIAHIYPSDLKTLKVKYLDRKVQDKLAMKIEKLNTNIESYETLINNAKQIQKQLINQIFNA